MRFAVLGDVHGNIYALRSVIEDINNRNVDFILLFDKRLPDMLSKGY